MDRYTPKAGEEILPLYNSNNNKNAAESARLPIADDVERSWSRSPKHFRTTSAESRVRTTQGGYIWIVTFYLRFV